MAFPRRCSPKEIEQRVQTEEREREDGRGEEAGGKHGGRIRSALMFCGRGRIEGGREMVPVRQRLNINKRDSFSVWESLHPALLLFPFSSLYWWVGCI